MGQPDLQLGDALEQARWALLANCKGKTHLFFAPHGEKPEARARREAIAYRYCATCSVQEPCRAWGREHHENGVWGGENEEDRALAGFAPRSINRRSVAEARNVGVKVNSRSG
jgi:WhiB family redox-sensing transcriptional regulator